MVVVWSVPGSPRFGMPAQLNGDVMAPMAPMTAPTGGPRWLGWFSNWRLTVSWVPLAPYLGGTVPSSQYSNPSRLRSQDPGRAGRGRLDRSSVRCTICTGHK